MPISSGDGGDEDVAMLMAQHGAARYADLETIDLCLDRAPAPAPHRPRTERGAPSVE